MPLLAEPGGDIALRTCEPWIQNEIEEVTSAWSNLSHWVGYLNQPGGVGIEVVEEWRCACTLEYGGAEFFWEVHYNIRRFSTRKTELKVGDKNGSGIA